MRHAISKDATRCYGGTTTKNQRMHQEDDCHLRALNTSIERQVAWTPLHSTKGVWTWPIPHDIAGSDEQTEVNIETKVYIEAIAC